MWLTEIYGTRAKLLMAHNEGRIWNQVKMALLFLDQLLFLDNLLFVVANGNDKGL